MEASAPRRAAPTRAAPCRQASHSSRRRAGRPRYHDGKPQHVDSKLAVSVGNEETQAARAVEGR
eukprot:4888935-Alexandrium_andersonii.AAC.1